jgi:NAD-dependent SIR2 family protein deacetylase
MTKYLEHNKFKEAARLLTEADCVFIGAGAGLSAAAGVNYGDEKVFAKLFAPLLKKGFRRQYELIGFNQWTEEEKWAYWATHVNYVRYEYPVSTVYTD